MSQAQHVTPIFVRDPPSKPSRPSRTMVLTAQITGDGTGTVTSSPGSLTCARNTCRGGFASGAAVTLTAIPTTGSTFGGWTGCSPVGGTPTQCTVTVSGTTIVTATFTGPIETATQTIIASIGGTITLPSGSSVTIPPGALGSDQAVVLSLVTELPTQPPSGVITGVGPALVLSFEISQPFQGTTQTEGIQFILKYGTDILSRLPGSLPITDIVDEDNFLGLVPLPCDSTDTCAVVPLSAVKDLPTTRSISVGAANLLPAVERAPLPTPGAKSWNGTDWVDGVGPLDPNAKTLVLVHGMLSSVEKAFDDPQKIQAIMDAGGYTRVVGFDYDWSKELTNTSKTGSGDLLANFLHSLKAAGLPQVDLEAHSLGGPVVLAASCVNEDMPIGNIALLGSPVNGTPAAYLSVLQGGGQGGAAALNTINPFHSVILNLVAQSPPSADTDTLQQLFNGPFAVQVQPGSMTLANIRSCVANKMATATNLSSARLICVAATDATKDPMLGTIASNGAYKSLFDGETFDGIVNKSSARCEGSGFDDSKVTRLDYPIGHTQLESDPAVIAGVGDAVKANVPPPPPAVEIWEGTISDLHHTTWITNPSGTLDSCTPSSYTQDATTSPHAFELDINGSLLTAGPFSGTYVEGPSTTTWTTSISSYQCTDHYIDGEGQTHTYTFDVPVTNPPPYSTPGDTGSIPDGGTSTGTAITIPLPNDAECTDFMGTIFADTTLTLTVTQTCQYSGIGFSTTDTLSGTLIRQ